ncbi:sugar phosphate isomerase/epimerase family protein [Phytomonospora sp. NPDC050363]|uniref:sugar phosphate isomerase/epimerase family protein n=1 Tax=Phytomonospora sp. NPDC050363 TaxID=3155642 RepID=UPI0034116137
MELCLNRSTLDSATPPDVFVHAARSAGFRAVELSSARLREAVARSPELCRIFTEGEVVPVHGGWNVRMHWPRERFFAAVGDVDGAMAFAVSLGSRSGTLDLPRPPLGDDPHRWRDDMIERLRAIGRLAVRNGLRVMLEFNGLWNRDASTDTGYRTLRAAVELVEEADVPSLGVLLDTFHWHASAGTAQDLAAIPSGLPIFVHVNDAPPLPLDQLDDAQRRLPGEGVIALNEFLTALADRGHEGPLSIELKTPELHAMEPTKAARHVHTVVSRTLGAFVEAEAQV